MHDTWQLLIRNALVFDGTGSPPHREDVAVAGGHIAARGTSLDPGRAERVIDASGRWLMPGLLDIHTHLDLEVELAPGLPESVRHGTTTVVVGNCSLGTAFGAQRRNGEDPILDCFARVENIPKSVLRKVVDRIDWTTTGGYLEHLAALPLGVGELALRLPAALFGIAGTLLAWLLVLPYAGGRRARIAGLLALADHGIRGGMDVPARQAARRNQSRPAESCCSRRHARPAGCR